jgi:epoxyqueuosine reductase
MSLEQRIREKAAELGIHKVGFARADALPDERARLEEWLHRGFHASMRWMENKQDKRTDPRSIVPGARTVISLAVNYYTPVPHAPNDDQGKISRYAWGDDYHIHVTRRIQSLFECIKQWQPDSEGRYYSDTGPVMEKVWAARAGLGWQGKHTNLITKEYGSWVFLGEIITTLELHPDPPMEDFCGTCTACIDACPTDAITEPYVVDSQRCISYLTIEHRGEIAAELGEKFDRWVYGCDICQDVCPWNRFQQDSEHPEFIPREKNIDPPLDELIGITQEEFSARFKNSPIKRTKREGIIRNALVVKEHNSNI